MRFANSTQWPTSFSAAAAVTLLAALPFSASAQSKDVQANTPPPFKETLNNRTLIRTGLQTNSTGVNVSCADNGCQAIARMFPAAEISCPGAVGAHCTITLELNTTTQISNLDQGLYDFGVDGLPPTIGPVASGGFYKFVENDPNSSATSSHSALIVATVTNSSVNQSHEITVSFACKDATGDGCSGFAALSSLRIDIFRAN
jgi:hypothetical protein